MLIDSMMRSRTPEDELRPDSEFALAVAFISRAWESPKVKITSVLWLFGMFFMLLAPGLTTVTPEMKIQYETMMLNAANMPEYQEAYANYIVAQEYADEAKVWFWRFREPYKTIVPDRQKKADVLQVEVDRLDAIREQKMRQAKAYVGLWSDFGMSEVRQHFWNAYEQGKLFAQEQTFYHMIMTVFSSRNEDMLGTLLHWILTALFNFTTGLIGSLFIFFYNLVSMVFTFQPDPLSGFAFIVMGLIGAASVIASYLLGIYGMVASGAYVVGKVMIRDALEQEQQRQRLRNQM